MNKRVITIPDTSINKQKQLNRNEPSTSENRNATQPNNLEEKVNLENFKRIMNEEKTTLPSLRNIE